MNEFGVLQKVPGHLESLRELGRQARQSKQVPLWVQPTECSSGDTSESLEFSLPDLFRCLTAKLLKNGETLTTPTWCSMLMSMLVTAIIFRKNLTEATLILCIMLGEL